MSKHIMLNKVRCNFPQLFGADVREGQTFNPGIAVVLEAEAHAREIREIKDAMKAAIALEPKLTASPPSGDRLCLRGKGMASWDERFEYLPDNIMLKAGNPKPPVVLSANMATIENEADSPIYSGCLVNIKIEVWGQANKFGKRVNAKLLAVQFAGDAEAWDASHVSKEEAVEGFGSLKGDSAGMGHVADEPDFLS